MRDAHLLWSRAGRLLIADRLRLTTARVVSVGLPSPVLSNTWWPETFDNIGRISAVDAERIVALWLNSTFRLLSLIGARADTEGAWVDLKKPILEQLPVLDPAALTNRHLNALLAAYDSLATQTLEPLPALAHDRVRADIDSAILRILGVRIDIAPLREMLAREPVFVRPSG